MSRVLDKFTYTTTYRQAYCLESQPPRITYAVKVMDDCKQEKIPGTIELPPEQTTVGKCFCQPGGLMPPRGAKARGLPTNLDISCPCFLRATCSQHSPINQKENQQLEKNENPVPLEVKKESVEDSVVGKEETEEKKEDDIENSLFIKDIESLYQLQARSKPPPKCPPFKTLRPLPRGKFGGQYEDQNAGRGNGVQERRDERRNPDLLRMRKQPPRGDTMTGEEGARRGRNPPNQEKQFRSDDVRIPGPFWTRQKDCDMSRKRKMDQQNDFPDAMVGEAYPDAHWTLERQGEDFPNGKEEKGDRENDAEPFPFTRNCSCAPPQPQSGPDKWALERDWGNLGGGRERRRPEIPSDVEEEIQRPPVARVSCAPESLISKSDQPNAFMRKLYEKYPYLHQVLRESPPEELMSRVFKDRFLSTYQVDYLHMGQSLTPGAETYEARDNVGGVIGPDGETEPEIIPGCSFRSSQRANFGRKKHDEKNADKMKSKKEEEEEPIQEEVKEEPRISEYKATISKLGGEIIQDQLYEVARLTKLAKKKM